MKIIVYLVVLLAFARLSSSQQSLPRVDHGAWDKLLRQFVNAQHRVDYGRLKREGSARLKDYIASLGQIGYRLLSPDEKKVLLVNAYNAFTIQWVLDNYPIGSIQSTSAPFTQARHRLGGTRVSLDQIESQLRAMGDPRIHAALVCAARSCPPLRREAYVGGRLDQQLDENVRQWLADRSLNTFDSEHAQAEISPIFEWYEKDFDSYPGGLQGFLRQYAPPDVKAALAERKFQIHFKKYDWRLNDQSRLGADYSELKLAIERDPDQSLPAWVAFK